MAKQLPLEERSIYQIYYEGQEELTYKIPIYQRNYAWEDDHIKALVKDVYDSWKKDPGCVYYIGTLVTYKRNDAEYEVIDGQQRLTTIYILLRALDQPAVRNKLTYSARKLSAYTIDKLEDYKELGEDVDKGISDGYESAKKAIKEIVRDSELDGFKKYFQNNVHIIHYNVPKDVDLNHYFEVMNSRGEQLEKHEIAKSKLSEALKDNKVEQATFCRVWDACSEMNMYIQQSFHDHEVEMFGGNIDQFMVKDFNGIPKYDGSNGKQTIQEMLSEADVMAEDTTAKEQTDKFQPIIDFPNFLLIVLKITLMKNEGFEPTGFKLDDKELLVEFDKAMNGVDKKEFAKTFAFNLLKAKYLLDNYIVHHTLSDDERIGDNPWQLQCYYKEGAKGNKRYPRNIADDEQDELVQLLSMLEVTFTPKQRKNYLFYCLLYLFDNYEKGPKDYLEFLRNLADKYFYDVYLNPERLTDGHQPGPNAFDGALLSSGKLDVENFGTEGVDYKKQFEEIYAQGRMDIPLYVFNYTDYILWRKYADEMRGNKLKESASDRKRFFDELGCGDFGLDSFDRFYFSRTRKSLEHYFPQAKADEINGPTIYQINCFGNFAMIGSQMNSSGNSWSAHAKLEHYTDGKTNPVSVASLKFKIMMQICKDNYQNKIRDIDNAWLYEDMQFHQKKMRDIIIKAF